MQDRQIARYFVEEPDPPAPLPFLEAANDLITMYSMQFPITIADAISLYVELVENYIASQEYYDVNSLI